MSNVVVQEPETSLEIDNNGRPYKYETHVRPRLEDICEWLKQGMTEYSIADQLGIHRHSLMKYKEEERDLIDVFTRARKERNCLVMNSMFRKANGDITVVKQEKLGKDGDKVVLASEIYTPPDVNAADLFLRNNDPDYKSAKADTGNLTLIQANINIPQIEAELEQIRQQRIQMAKVIEIED